MKQLSGVELRLKLARPYGAFIDGDDRRSAVKDYAKTHGYRGAQGGWIYNTAGRPIVQGWDNFFWMRQSAIADELTVKLTAFNSFYDMVANTAPTYRPTILPTTWRERLLADLYDQAQIKRQDPRRAYVGFDRYDRAAWEQDRRLRDQEAAS